MDWYNKLGFSMPLCFSYLILVYYKLLIVICFPTTVSSLPSYQTIWLSPIESDVVRWCMDWQRIASRPTKRLDFQGERVSRCESALWNECKFPCKYLNVIKETVTNRLRLKPLYRLNIRGRIRKKPILWDLQNSIRTARNKKSTIIFLSISY
jgi:hypothetical protein